jgi:pentatricopeptide repeat protein
MHMRCCIQCVQQAGYCCSACGCMPAIFKHLACWCCTTALYAPCTYVLQLLAAYMSAVICMCIYVHYDLIHEQGGQYDHALELLHEMRDAGIKPDKIAYR